MLAFEDIEAIIGKELPVSAHKHRSFWANDNQDHHSHARAWMQAGYRVAYVDREQKVTDQIAHDSAATLTILPFPQQDDRALKRFPGKLRVSPDGVSGSFLKRSSPGKQHSEGKMAWSVVNDPTSSRSPSHDFPFVLGGR